MGKQRTKEQAFYYGLKRREAKQNFRNAFMAEFRTSRTMFFKRLDRDDLMAGERRFFREWAAGAGYDFEQVAAEYQATAETKPVN